MGKDPADVARLCMKDRTQNRAKANVKPSNRRLDNKFNIFEGISHNWFFVIINVIMIGGQVMIIFVGGKAFKVTPLTGAQWGISIVLGALSIPVAIIIRLIPDHLIAKLVPTNKWKKSLAPDIYDTKEANIKALRRRGSRPEELSFIRSIRGGRVSSLRLKIEDKISDKMHIHGHGHGHGKGDEKTIAE